MKQKMFALITALASLAIALTIQQQDVAAFNDKNNQNVGNTHSHQSCQTGSCDTSDGHVFNSEEIHSNDNFNSHRDDPGPKDNTFVKPGNDK